MSKSTYPAIVPGLKVRHRETLEERTVKIVRGRGVVYFDQGEPSEEEDDLWDDYEPLPQPGDRVRVVRVTADDDMCRGSVGILRKTGSRDEYEADSHYGPLSDFEVILPEESELPEPVESMLLDDRGEMPGLPPESDATPDEAFDLGRIAGYNEAMRDVQAEESETNMINSEMKMINNETVAVPVELIRRVLYNEYQSDEQLAMSEMAALLPKPKPRLVAVDPLKVCNFITNWLEDDELARELVEDLGKHVFDAQPDLLDTIRSAVYGSHAEDHMVATDVVMREIFAALEQTDE